MLWTWSDHGKGQVSRNFHRWARRYGIRDGDKPRPVLLNNWEATGMNFDEKTIVSLFDGAKELGADTFLLDDGWFGNAHPRNQDNAGLGDWQVNTNKLPHGLSYLADEANKRGINFGIWIEPEMVNPTSDLFETASRVGHPAAASRTGFEPQPARSGFEPARRAAISSGTSWSNTLGNARHQLREMGRQPFRHPARLDLSAAGRAVANC